MTDDTIAKRIRSARLKAAMSQGDLAKAVGVSIQAVSQWERGKTVPDFARAQQIGDALGILGYWLLVGDAIPSYNNVDAQILADIGLPPIPIVKFDQVLHFAPTLVNTGPVDKNTFDLVMPHHPNMERGFAVRVTDEIAQGDFKSGDILLFSTETMWKDEDMVVAISFSDRHRASEPVFGRVTTSEQGDKGEHLVISHLDEARPAIKVGGLDHLGMIIGVLQEQRRLFR